LLALAPSRFSLSGLAAPSRFAAVAARLASVFALLLYLLGLSPLGLSRSAHAQGIFIANGTAVAQDGNKITPSFTLLTQSTDVKDSIDEFQRFVKHEAWDKAFKSLETIASKTSTGYMDRSDGVLVPNKLLARSLLASLPSAGKNAYRVFYDPQANSLWDKAVGKAEAENLSAIVNNHLISSVGDRAADRLGDLLFEQGELEQAVTAWRSILDYCPDSQIPKAQTLVKVATALARSARWNEFQEVEQTVRERHASETVELGGRRVTAGEHIARLAAVSASSQPSLVQGLPPDMGLPVSEEPLWQFRYQSKADPLNPNNPFSIVDVYGRSRVNDFFIPATADDKRVYVNLFGIEMAFDLENGKLLWRSGKLHQLQLQQQRQGIVPERYGVKLVGDRLWSVSRDPQQLNQHPITFALIAREAATGKELYNSRKSQNAWNILSEPCPSGDVLYVGASRATQGRELAVLMLSAKDGKLLKTFNVGNHAVDQNQIYMDRIAQPTFLLHGDRLYVDTNGGALLALDPQTGTVEWGILYESPSPPVNYYPQFTTPAGSGPPVYVGGLLFSKGMRSTRLLGVQVAGPELIWNRPVLKSAVMVGADEEHIYMAGEELTAYDLKTQELVWSTQLPRTAIWSVPLLTKNRLYQFTSRGICEVDKRTGQLLKIFRGVDLDSFGGTMFVTTHGLLTVSNLAVTAYPLSPGAREARKSQ